MLVLTRKASEKIRIGKDILLTIVRIDGNKVRIGIDAPDDVTITREELSESVRPMNQRELALC